MQSVLEAPQESQQFSDISREDRRLLLGASIRLLGHRFSCGKLILRDDLLRVSSLADDAQGWSA